ncbi:MAG TPA: glucose-6-phosphate isomerase, partial [Spirochaetota bacterium]|nr:glucose-6-phosphate isomerase [Spirochaetota bacterium]
MYKNLTKTKTWQKLQKHAAGIKKTHLRQLFRDKERFAKFHLTCDSMLLDYSKNLITAETMQLLTELAKEAELTQKTEAMFNGAKINWTEERAVLHTALRNRSGDPVKVDGKDVMPLINKVLTQMQTFSEAVRSGAWQGATGKKI